MEKEEEEEEAKEEQVEQEEPVLVLKVIQSSNDNTGIISLSVIDCCKSWLNSTLLHKKEKWEQKIVADALLLLLSKYDFDYIYFSAHRLLHISEEHINKTCLPRQKVVGKHPSKTKMFT